MAITSPEFPHNMSAWLCEKSSNVLKKACLLEEWLQRKAESLSAEEKEEISDALLDIIYHGAVLFAFGNENTQACSSEWASVIAAQGRERLEEYERMVSGSILAKPAEFPESMQSVLGLLNETLGILHASDSSITLTRMKLVGKGEMFKTIQGEGNGFLADAGDRLLDLIDKQSFENSLSWPQLVEAAKPLIEGARSKYIESVERLRWSPGREPKHGLEGN